MALDKVKALAYFSTSAVLEVELSEMEASETGHVQIGMLCLLAVAEQGLREVELRQLLADEKHLLPVTMKRANKLALPYGESALSPRNSLTRGAVLADSSHGQIGPVRFRMALLRLKHHLIDIGDAGENRLALGSAACRRAVQKR